MEAGQAALRSGRWEDARAAFEASLAERETADALAGLGEALWWLCEARSSARHRARAFVLYRRADDPPRACRTAIDLSICYLVNLGSAAAAHGWLSRAETVMRQHAGSNPLEGWLCLMHGFLADDPDGSRERLREALDFARATGDIDLELVALSDLGLALVTAGRVDEGLALLDEAMAGTVAGEYTRLDTVVFTSCNMLAACARAGDLTRATQWCRAADDFMRQVRSPFLFARCRVDYGALLLDRGHWREAGQELEAAVRLAEDAGTGARAEAAALLAELRVRQGRLEEAEALLAVFEDPLLPALPAAAARLARGEAAVAVSLLERRLDRLSDAHADAPATVALLVEACIAAGDVDAAGDASARLDGIAARGDRPRVTGLALFAAGQVALAAGRFDAAGTLFERALEQVAPLQLPLETARIRLALARASVGRQAGLATVEARRALAAFEELGAAADADRAAALLRDLGAPGRSIRRPPGELTRREHEVLRLVGLGLSNPEIAQRLFISRKTAAHHVSSILAKLGLRNRAEAVVIAVRDQPVDAS